MANGVESILQKMREEWMESPCVQEGNNTESYRTEVKTFSFGFVILHITPLKITPNAENL